jgi:nucleoside-diphosphate-sugar epimerase
MNTALILGGAGFIGSHIAERFHAEGWSIVVIDSINERTSARRENLSGVQGITLIDKTIETVENLDEYISAADIVIDAMAWTAHLLALHEPEFDHRLNQASHLHVATALARHPAKQLLFLSSRGVYGAFVGDVHTNEITEETPLLPEDIQGVHKLAAESYYRIYAKLYKYSVVSLRFGNCFGERMPTHGKDIGLIGGFIRDVLEGRAIEIFGTHRSRPVVYVQDVVEYVWRIAAQGGFDAPFTAYNLNGQNIGIHTLAQQIVDSCASEGITGECIVKPLPHEIKTIDIGSTPVNCDKIKAATGFTPSDDWTQAMKRTVEHFKQNL